MNQRSEAPPTETVSDARLQDLINLYDGQAFRGDTVLALEELQRLRHYVATCGGTDNDGRCPMHHLAGLRSSGGASGCGHVPAGYSCVTPGCSNGPAPEPTETLYTAKDVEALFAIRDAAVAAHAAKPVATAWMRDGVIENAFPRPPRSAEEWAKYDADGYWKAKGYSEAPLYSAPPSPPEPRDEPLPPCSTCGGETVPFCTSCGYTTTKSG